MLLGEVVIPVLFLSKAPAIALHWEALLKYPLALLYPGVLLTSPLGEEPGWRGYALPKLQRMIGPFWATMLLGAVWAMWHLPLFLVKGWTSASVPVFLMILVGWSIIITCVFNWAGGSVIVAVLAHSAGNAGGRFMGDLLTGVPTRDGVSGELVIALSLLALAALLTVFTRGRLGEPAPENHVDGTQQNFAQDAEQTRCSEPGDDALVSNRGSAAPGR
jgi:membrane protease YdiL (CAAX protease family)